MLSNHLLHSADSWPFLTFFKPFMSVHSLTLNDLQKGRRGWDSIKSLFIAVRFHPTSEFVIDRLAS
jgi:hypothetical protein